MKPAFKSVDEIKVGMIVCRVDGTFKGRRATVLKTIAYSSVYIEMDLLPGESCKPTGWYERCELAPFEDASIDVVYAMEPFTHISQVVIGMKVFRSAGIMRQKIATVKSVILDGGEVNIAYDSSPDETSRYLLEHIVSAFPLTSKPSVLIKDDDPIETKYRKILTSAAVDAYTCSRCAMPMPCKWH